MDQLYDHYSVSYGSNVNAADGTFRDNVDPLDQKTPVPTTAQLVSQNLERARFQSQSDQYFLFVHGWRMQEWERVAFAESAYKRLYWSGYTGQFGMFDWPTQYVDTATRDSGNFDRSEFIAWNSAAGLSNALHNIRYTKLANPATGKLSVMAHSMGNIVLSEALYKNELAAKPIVDNAVLSQAAISSHYFTTRTDLLPSIYQTGKGGNHLASTVIQYTNPTQWTQYIGFNPQMDGIGGQTPRFANIGKAASRIFDYYNPDDFALGVWKLDQALKPTKESTGVLTTIHQLNLGNVDLTGGTIAEKALSMWQAATGRQIPGFSNTEYTDASGGNGFWRFYTDATPNVQLSFPKNQYEMFAFDASSAVAPLGTVSKAQVPGLFLDDRDLRTLDPVTPFTTANTGHSAEFVHALVQVDGYWMPC